MPGMALCNSAALLAVLGWDVPLTHCLTQVPALVSQCIHPVAQETKAPEESVGGSKTVLLVPALSLFDFSCVFGFYKIVKQRLGKTGGAYK